VRRILLTGANGQLGFELRRALATLGEVIALDRRALDLSRGAAIGAAVARSEPSLIVNAAAYTAVDRAEDEEALARQINAEAPALLAEQAAHLGIPLIHYSTDYVSSGRATEPMTEQTPAEPLNAYGRTKLEGEQAIAGSGAEHLIFRTSWVYGARGRNFLLTVLRLARERDELRVVADQIGAPTWCRALAEATAQVVAQLWAPAASRKFADVSGLYHLSAGGETSWHGFAQAILDGVPGTESLCCREVTPIPSSEYPTLAERPRYSVLDNGRFRDTFGFGLPDWRFQLGLVMEDIFG
jgi:dTDP-4-dehydrorhamnose reductase